MKRVILKLSGEALAGEQKSGYDDALIADIARQVKAIIDKGIDVGVVIGGGNYWRASRKWKMGNSPYLPIYIECVFRIQ